MIAATHRMLRISSYHSPNGPGLDITSGVPPHPSDPSNYLGNSLIPGDGERPLPELSHDQLPRRRIPGRPGVC